MTAMWVIVGLSAWLSATFLPIYLFWAFRRLATRSTSAWAIHMLFAPTLLATSWVSAFFMNLADGDQSRAPDERGLGILLLPALLVLLAVLGIYYGSIVVATLRRFKSRRANVR